MKSGKKVAYIAELLALGGFTSVVLLVVDCNSVIGMIMVRLLHLI